jgi:hypothetical protein
MLSGPMSMRNALASQAKRQALFYYGDNQMVIALAWQKAQSIYKNRPLKSP